MTYKELERRVERINVGKFMDSIVKGAYDLALRRGRIGIGKVNTYSPSRRYRR